VLTSQTDYIYIKYPTFFPAWKLLRASTQEYLFSVPDRGFLTGQRQITRWVALWFGQAAVFTAAVLQDVSSGMHPVLWITQDNNNVKHITDRLFTKCQMRKLTVIWRKRVCHVLGCCGLEEKQPKSLVCSRVKVKKIRLWSCLRLWGRGCWREVCVAEHLTSLRASPHPPPGWERMAIWGCWREDVWSRKKT